MIANDESAHPAPLAASDLRFRYAKTDIIDELTLEITEGTVTTLVGPNGCGKSTLLKNLGRILRPSKGVVYLNGKAISQMSSKAVAREMAILPQGPVAPEGITVRGLVEQGRFANSGALRMLKRQDHEAIDQALELTDMTSLSGRALDNLSGGERQRAWIALALAQSTDILLLDEPTTFLDIGHQLEVLELTKRLNEEQGKTILLVLHDLNHAATYSHRMVAMRKGTIVRDGRPDQVLTADLLRDVFGVHATVFSLPETSHPLCHPFASVRNRPITHEAAGAPPAAS
jgi:iron complex transport system ATP-binding protein